MRPEVSHGENFAGNLERQDEFCDISDNWQFANRLTFRRHAAAEHK